MGTPGRIGELVLGFLICTGTPLLWFISLMRKRQYLIAPLSIWVFVYFFLGFKQAFVRSDEFHLFSGLVDMILPACLIIVAQQLTSSFPTQPRLGHQAV